MSGKILSNGQIMPDIGMGTFGSDKYSPEQVAGMISGAVEAGYRMLDCASVYQNEHLIGEALQNAMEQHCVRRDEMFITSKVWNDMHGDGNVLLSAARSLKDLKLDYIDLYFVHWPYPNYHPPGCAADSRSPDARPYIHSEFMSVWRQMERLYKTGLVRAIGVSNLTARKLELLLRDCEIKPAAMEMELHPTFQQRELYEMCEHYGIAVIGYCPLGSPSRPERDRTTDDVSDMDMDAVRRIAATRGITPAAVCLKWAVTRGHTPIPFSVTPERYTANLAAALGDRLTDDEMRELEGCERGCRLVKGHVFLWQDAGDWNDLWDDSLIVE